MLEFPKKNKHVVTQLRDPKSMIDLTQEEELSPQVLDLSQLDNDIVVEDLTQQETSFSPDTITNIVVPSTCKHVDENTDKSRREEIVLHELETRAKSLKRLLDIGKRLDQGLKKNKKEERCTEEPRGETSAGVRVAPRPSVENQTGAVKKKSAQLTEASRAMKQIRRQFETEKYILKFIEAVMSPDVMMEPLGLGIGQAFQQTAEKAEHERISYRVDRHSEHPYPFITWNRKIPSNENVDCFDIEVQPYMMVCIDGKKLVEWIQDGKVEEMIHALSQRFTSGERFRISILVYRLDQTLREKESKDHKESMSHGRSPEFCAEKIRQYLMDLSVQMPHIEIFDAHSIEEASSHVLSVTKAIASRHIDVGSAGKYIAGKAKGRTASSALNSLLAKEPLEKEMIYPLKALMALQSVVPAVAHKIVKEFSSFSGLYDFLEDPATTQQQKIGLLENMISSNGRRVGPKAAKQIVDAFLSEDPSMSIE